MTVTNKDRAEWAAAALRHYQIHTGSLYEDSLGDILGDLMHFAHANNFDFKAALDRARGNYAEEFFEEEKVTPPAPTPYMAEFHIPAGTARQVFCANSPEEALQKARKFSDDANLTESDFDPITEGYCVREITICDEHGQQHAIWQTDEYRLQLQAPELLKALESQVEATRQIIDAWNETDDVPAVVEDLIEAFERHREAANAALYTWENGDLAGAVRDLDKSLTCALKAIAAAKGGAE